MKYLILAAVAILVLLILVTVLIYLIPKLFAPSPQVVTPTPIPLVTTTPLTPSPIITGVPPPGTVTLDSHIGRELTVFYPESWSILTCNNSDNFELDPLDNIDEENVTCDVAVKPISVVVQNTTAGCNGEQVNIGNVPTIRSVTSSTNVTLYRWCTITQPILNITHRVSPTSFPAASPINYSTEIETMISNLRFT